MLDTIFRRQSIRVFKAEMPDEDTLLVLADEQRGIALTKDEVLFQQLEGFLSREEEL